MAAVVRVDPEHRTFVLMGELDMSNSVELDAAIEQADWLDGGSVRFDLSGLTFVDSCGLQSLLGARAPGRKVVFDRPTSQVRRVLEITGLSATPGIEIRNADGTKEPKLAEVSDSAAM